MPGNAVWITGIALLYALGIVLAVRRMHRHVPIFFSYIAFLCLSEIPIVILHRRSYFAYFYAYWIREALLAPLELAVVYEVVISVFSAYPAIQKLLKVCGLWAFLLLLMIGGFVALAFPSHDSDAVLNAVLVMDRSLRIIDVGLLLLLFLFAYFLRMRWPHYALGIAVGLALSFSVELVELAVRTAVGTAWNSYFSVIHSASFIVALLLWNVTSLSSERRIQVGALPPSQLQEWNRALASMLSS